MSKLNACWFWSSRYTVCTIRCTLTLLPLWLARVARSVDCSARCPSLSSQPDMCAGVAAPVREAGPGLDLRSVANLPEERCREAACS